MSNDKSRVICEFGVILSRRTALGLITAGAGVGAVAQALPVTAANVSAAPVAKGEVVAIHMGMPYIDKSGTATPYIPAAAGDRYAALAASGGDMALLGYDHLV